MNGTHLVIVGMLAITVATGCNKDESAEAQARSRVEAPIAVSTAVAQGREVPIALSVTGTLMPDQQSQLTALVSGRVTDVYVERGSRVKRGQPILRLRDADFRSAADAASAALEQARAQLGIANDNLSGFNPEATPDVGAARAARDLAEDSLRRAEALRQTASISDQEYERATLEASSAREQYQAALNRAKSSLAQFKNAQVQLEQARRALSDSIVRAPFDGEVAERYVNVGEFVTSQKPVVMLVQAEPLRFELQVPQENVAYVQVGQTVTLRVDAFPDRVFTGTIRYVSAAVRQNSRSLVAEAVIPNQDRVLRPGLFATARLELGSKRPAAEVPKTALLSEAGVHRVFVIDKEQAQERVVSIIEQTQNGTVLLSNGVRAGERVATSQLSQLGDGAKVKVN